MRLTDATYRIEGRTLRIRKTEPDGHRPREIEVRLDGGAWAATYEMATDMTDDDFASAMAVARRVYGVKKSNASRFGPSELPACTNSEVHEIWNAMRDIAGC
jgi:hypothetical protein